MRRGEHPDDTQHDQPGLTDASTQSGCRRSLGHGAGHGPTAGRKRRRRAGWAVGLTLAGAGPYRVVGLPTIARRCSWRLGR
jgi:hypothetical protein